jgi:hypothetical protein
MASQTLVPIYETGTALTDVFVGALYIDTTSSFYARALIGSTLSGTEVRVKVKTTYSTSDSATANIVTSTSLALVEQSESSPFSLTAGSYAYFYITCAAAGASWQCPAITLTMVELV